MSGFDAPYVVYTVLLLVLVLSSLVAMRLPAGKAAKMALAWVAIFAGAFVLFTFRDDLGLVAQRLKAEAVGTPVQQGEETRIPMASDGHFWVEGELNGQSVRFLVDSGATMTTVGRQTALRAGVEVSPRPDQLVRTGNGIIRVSRGRADELRIGGITRRDIGVQVAETENLNVLGMNFLSSLSRWSVEGRWLVLVP